MLETLIILTAILIGVLWTLVRLYKQFNKKLPGVDNALIISLVIAWYEDDQEVKHKAAQLVSKLVTFYPAIEKGVYPEHRPTLEQILKDARTDT